MGKGNGGTRTVGPPRGTKKYESPSSGEFVEKTDRGMTAEQRKKVLDFERRKRNEKVEWGMTVDKDGKVVVEKKGKSNQVSWEYDEIPKDGVLTHIHPPYENISKVSKLYASIGSPFSRQDIEVAIRRDLKEIRAVTPNYVFSMQRPKNGWGVTEEQFTKEYNRIKRKYNKEMVAYQNLGGKWDAERWGRVNVAIFHQTMRDTAKKFGFTYIRTKTIK